MAPGVRLSRFAAAAAILAGGGLVEAASDQSFPAAAADWLVGAAFVGVGVSRRGRRPDPVALLAATWWYLATLALTPDGWWHGLDGALALAYRGPVLHLLARPVLGGRLRWPVLVAAYAVPLVISPVTGWLTGLVALGFTLLVVGRDRPSAALLAVLAAAWVVIGLDVVTGTAATVVGNTALLLVGAVLGLRHRPGIDRVVADMIVELGQDDRPASPLSASLAEALGDPALRIAVFEPEAGWRDDEGRPVAPPDLDALGGRLTVAPVPGGGSLALVHGPNGVADPDLAAAAARAVVLVLQRVRLTTQLRLTADEVRRSAERLLAVDEQERTALAARLAAGPRRRLRKVRALLEPDEVARLDEVDAELDRLARGLLPAAVGQGSLTEALGVLAAGATLPVDLRADGPVDELPEQVRVLVYFVVAECLTNVAKHARATLAEVCVAVAAGRLQVEVTDDGAGGADPLVGHGLQGLADRVILAGGTLSVTSPVGGPTTVVAEVRLDR